MSDRLPTESSFLEHVACHEMIVLHDDGHYRHLRFRRPNTWSYGFDVTTWPGYLCFSGDMGCYVFARIADMIDFFRSDRPGDGLHINPGYWGEKVQAADRCSPIKEYSPEKFKAAVVRRLDEAGASQSVRQAVEELVISRADDGEHEAIRAALDFEHDGFTFQDFWEVSVKELSYRFLWCCYAVAWGVRQYDKQRQLEEVR